MTGSLASGDCKIVASMAGSTTADLGHGSGAGWLKQSNPATRATNIKVTARILMNTSIPRLWYTSAMSKTSLIRLCATALLLVGGWAAYTQNPPAAQLTLEKVKEDLYVIVGDGGNVAVYVTSEGVILVDDKFERNYADIQAKVKSVTDKPVKYVLNTHQHGDHTGGNEKLLPSAEILIHKNARANMASTKMPGLPRVTYTD